MIHDVDGTVRALLKRDAFNGSDIDVSFETPTKDWASKRTMPTVNVYLFDLREDIKRRRVEAEDVYDDEGLVIGRRRPPRRFRLSYLITAWTQRPEDEHRLLGSVLNTFIHLDEMPRDMLQGSLGEEPLPFFITIGLPPPPERSIGEIWSAMGGELKASLELVVSAPFMMPELIPAGPPVEEEPRFEVDTGLGTIELATAMGRKSGISVPRPRGPKPTKPSEKQRPEPKIVEEIGGGRDTRGRRLFIQTTD